MSQDVREVRVDIRHHTLASAARLQESKDGEVFIALDDPPPVRTILAIHEGSDGPHALEVTRVVETDTDASRRGAYGRFRDADLLRGLDAVGTEHLSAGEQPTSPDDGEHGGYMAMPAPVVDPDPSDRIDVNELRQLEENGEDSDDDESESDDGAPSESAPDLSSDEGAKKGKRRRGRKRRPN